MWSQTSLQQKCRASLFGVAAAMLVLSDIAPVNASDLMPFDIEFTVGNDLVTAGQAKLKLVRNGDQWVYSLNTLPTGVFKITRKGRIQEISIFGVDDSQTPLTIQPSHYSFRQDSDTSRSVDATFDWTEKQMTYSSKGEQGSEVLDKPVVDRLAVTLNVMDALHSENFNQAQFDVFDNGRVKSIEFTKEANESVSTKLGTLDTIRVKSQTAGGSSRHTLTWFAPALGYVPVKIEQYKRNKLIARLTLSELDNHTQQ